MNRSTRVKCYRRQSNEDDGVNNNSLIPDTTLCHTYIALATVKSITSFPLPSYLIIAIRFIIS